MITLSPNMKKILIGGATLTGIALVARAFMRRSTATPSKLPAPRVGGTVLPVENGKITSLLGPRKPPKSGASSDHPGIDFAAPEGTVVRTYRSGTIKAIKSRADGNSAGNRIQIDHGDDTMSWYFHLQDRDFGKGWKVGDRIAAGATIGRLGSTGNVTGPHLHFEIRKTSQWKIVYDPTPALFAPTAVASLEAKRFELNRVA